MRVITDISEIDKVQWHRLLEQSRVASFFQSPEVVEFINGQKDMAANVFAVEENGELQGLAVVTIYQNGTGLKRKLSTRAVINGGLLLPDNSSHEAVRQLLDTMVLSLRKQCSYIEIRNFSDYTPWQDTIENNGFRYQPHYNFHISTEGFKERMGKTRRYEVRRGLKEGAEIDCSPNEQEVRELYAILQELYETRVKRPLFCLEFFENLYRESFSTFIIVRHQGRVIGGTVCVGLPGQMLYEWFACGKSGGEYKYLFPSTLATYGAIDYAATHGHPRFDMMGAGTPDDGGYGVRDFKAQFGGELVEHGRFLYVCKPLIYSLGKKFVSLKEKL